MSEEMAHQHLNSDNSASGNVQDRAVHWDKTNFDAFPSYFIENIDSFLRYDKKTLIYELTRLPLDTLKELRNRLSSEFLTKIPYGSINYVLFGRASQATVASDINLLVTFLSSKDSPAHDQFSKVYKIKTEKHNFHESPESIEFFKTQTHSMADITTQLKNLTEITNRILQENQVISKENRELRSAVIELTSLTKTTVKIPNTFVFPQPSPLQPPAQQTKNYASAVATQPPTPRQKRSMESDGFETSKAKTPRTQTQTSLKQFDSSQPHLANRDLNDNDGFILKTQRKPKSNEFVKKLGTGPTLSSSTTLRIRPRKQLVFLSQCEVGTTAAEVEAFLKTVVYKDKPLSFSDLRPASIRSSKFSAFHFEIDYTNRDVVRDKGLWPAGLFVDFSHPQRAPASTSEPSRILTTQQ